MLSWGGARRTLSLYRRLPIQGVKSGVQSETDFLPEGVRVYHADRFLVGPISEQRFLQVSLATTQYPEGLQNGMRLLRQALKVEH